MNYELIKRKEEGIYEHLKHGILYPKEFLTINSKVRRRLQEYYIYLLQYETLDSFIASKLCDVPQITVRQDFQKLTTIGVCRYIQKGKNKLTIIEFEKSHQIQWKDDVSLDSFIYRLTHYQGLLYQIEQQNEKLKERIKNVKILE